MSAVISPCGNYRYTLTRKIPQPVRWVKGILFIMLNPSTADESQNDATIRRCMSFAAREGATDMTVVNLLAFRARDPARLKQAEDPFGPENQEYLMNEVTRHRRMDWPVVAAWGAHPIPSQGGVDTDWLRQHSPIYCLGKTKHGHPRHPLYVRADQPLELYL